MAEWVADAVLSKEDSRKRAAIVKQFITVADVSRCAASTLFDFADCSPKKCRLMKNFSTMAAIVAGAQLYTDSSAQTDMGASECTE